MADNVLTYAQVERHIAIRVERRHGFVKGVDGAGQAVALIPR